MLQRLKTQTKARSRPQTGGRFVIVASRYNGRHVNSMLQAARAELQRGGATVIEVVRVPGAFEMPAVVARLARQRAPAWDALICLGVILRGETVHADLIARGVTEALVRVQVETGIPVVHEVLLLENHQQARARCLSPEHNRGTEAAQTALAMKSVLARLPGSGDPRS
jgi:6,7-dimethyl-8-ribityllumazine synthase